MGLGHSTSPVLSTHVILLGMLTKSHIFSYLKNACTGASPCMLADVSWTRQGTLQHNATAIVLVIVQLDH